MKMSFAPPTPRTTVSATSSTMLFLRLFFFFVSLHKVVFGDLTITTPQGLIAFSNEVNSGPSYSGSTVYLAADLDFNSSLSQQFHPIGNSTSCYFNGTFDGQGHIIKSLNMSTPSQYVGLFGYSGGAPIKNVIFDESCYFMSSHSGSGSSPDVGSIAGYCSSCTVENVVNMASVTCVGHATALRIGGIVGRISSSSTVRNCVNYGTVTQSGNVTYAGSLGSSYVCTYIGGIVGFCGGSSVNSIQNCANYGTLAHNGVSYNLYVGGITGINYAGNSIIENCVSAGRIINTTQGNESNNIGSVVGYADYHTFQTTPSTLITITHCLWTSDVGYEEMCGGKHEPVTVTVTDSTIVILDITAMNELNEYAEANSWGKWFMLHLNGGTINSLTQDTLIVTQKHFPVPVKEGYTFSFWCMDAECADVYDPETTDITAITDLYAGYTLNKYVVTFNFGNGTIKTKKVSYGEKYGTLPDAGERTGWTFIGWFTGVDGSGDEITSETTVSIADDHALYAHWTINNYTLRFILDNGENDIVKTLNYSDPIYYPGDPVREGYTFDEWSPNPDTMPAHNLNITAQWTKIYTKVTEYVEIVFDKKGLSEDDVKTIIRKYANDDDFVIENIETVNGETKVIVKFTDTSKAEEFIRCFNEKNNSGSLIKRVGIVSNYNSFSVISYPSTLVILILVSVLTISLHL